MLPLPAGQGDFWRIDEFEWDALTGAASGLESTARLNAELIAPFLPPYARPSDEARGEKVRVTPEHRRTVIAFVNILGLNDLIERAGEDAALEQLQAYAATFTALAAKHQGFVVSSDIATKGSKLIVTFGTPVAHEYAPANAARFALDLDAYLRDPVWRSRRRSAFTGATSSPERWARRSAVSTRSWATR